MIESLAAPLINIMNSIQTGLFLQLVHTTDNIHDITDPRMADVVAKVKLMEHRIFEEADNKVGIV